MIRFTRYVKGLAINSAVGSLLAARALAWVNALLAVRFRLKLIGRCYVSWSAKVTGWSGVRLGNNVVISRGSWLNVNHRGDGSASLIIGDNVFLGQGNLLATGKSIVIRDYCVSGPNCAFICSSHTINDPEKHYASSGVTNRDEIYVGVNCYFGYGCTLIGNLTIGHGSIVGAGSIVTHDVPPFSLVVGSPARVIKHYDFQSKQWMPGNERAHADYPAEDEYLALLRQKRPFPIQPVSAAAEIFGDV